MALRRNVLLFHSGALGDFILSWPLALAFGRIFAQSRIFYVSHKQKGELAERALRIESADIEAGWHELYSERPNLPSAAGRLLDGAHAIAAFGADADSLWVRNVRAIAPHAELLPIAAHPPKDFIGHHTDFLLEQLRPLSIWQQAAAQILSSIRQRGLGIEPATGGPVVVHPGSGSPSKCWPLECYVALANQLRSQGRPVRFVIGEVEREKWPAAAIQSLELGGELRQPETLAGLLDCLKGASAFIGNDSGPGHLAGILGLPTVSLFGPTEPGRWIPIGPRVTAIRQEPLGSITVDRVAQAISG